MNGPLKLLTTRKSLPLLDLLSKFKRALAAREANFLSLKNNRIEVLGMLANARKDHSSPLLCGTDDKKN